jgi:hypothetical protein
LRVSVFCLKRDSNPEKVGKTKRTCNLQVLFYYLRDVENAVPYRCDVNPNDFVGAGFPSPSV